MKSAGSRVDGQTYAARASDLDFLLDLAQPVGPRFVHEGDTVRQRIWSPSLLASYAYMVLRDIEPLQLLFICPECGRLFSSRAHRVNYCGVACRNKVSKRKMKAPRG